MADCVSRGVSRTGDYPPRVLIQHRRHRANAKVTTLRQRRMNPPRHPGSPLISDAFQSGPPRDDDELRFGSAKVASHHTNER